MLIIRLQLSYITELHSLAQNSATTNSPSQLQTNRLAGSEAKSNSIQSTKSEVSEFKYRPEIDGLRAVAVVPVVLFHLHNQWMAGGYIGVDVFFVISGFLITSIIFKELHEGSFSFRDFWSRRIRRIFPAMILVVGTTLAAISLAVRLGLLYKPDQQEVGGQALAALLSFANIYFWKVTGDYWGTAAEQSPFLHTWSLSLEEQFYVFFPLVMWILFRFNRHWVLRILVALVLTSFGLFLWSNHVYPAATFFLLPTRIWELCTGSLLAVILHRNRSRDDEKNPVSILATLGLGMIILSYFLFPQLNAGLALAVGGTGLIIAFGQSGFCYRFLSLRPMIHIGKISYSLYLWHWPVLVIARNGGMEQLTAAGVLIYLFTIYAISLASYRFIESTTRRRKKIIPVILACFVMVAAFAVTLRSTSQLYDSSQFNKPQYYGAYYTLTPAGFPTSVLQKYEDWDIPQREAPSDSFRHQGIVFGSDQPEIVVLGDSHGAMWANTIRTAADSHRISTAFFTANGVSPFIDFPLEERYGVGGFSASQKLEFDRTRIEQIQKWKPKLVIICTSWSDRKTDEVDGLMNFLEESGTQVLLIEQPPMLAGVGKRNCMQHLIHTGIELSNDKNHYQPIDPTTSERYQKGRQIAESLAQRYDNCDFLSVLDLYLQNGKALVLKGRDIVYFDSNHLSEFGAQLAASRIATAIASICQEAQLVE